MTQKREGGWVGRGLLAGLIGTALLACRGAAQVPLAVPLPGTAESCQTAWTSEPPVSSPAASLTWPRSRLWIRGRVAQTDLMEELERRVPRVLADRQTRSVGSFGRVTYSVRRLSPRLVARTRELEIQVPLEATVELCKPFGSTCLRYGGCEPAFLSAFRVPSVVGADYRMAVPRGSIEATRRCVIGLDVTPQILREADKELRAVERQLARSLPDLRPVAQALWDGVQRPQPLADDQCLRFVPDVLAHAPVRLNGEQLEVRLGLSGVVELADCDAGASRAVLPPLFREESPPASSELWVPRRVAFHTLGQAIEEQLGLPLGTKLSRIEVAPHGERVLVGLGWEGRACGASWLSGRPHFDAQSGELSLEEVRPEAPLSGEGVELTREVARGLEAVRLGVVVDTRSVTELLNAWVTEAETLVPRLSLELTAESPSRGEALVYPGGVLVAAALEPKAVLSATGPLAR